MMVKNRHIIRGQGSHVFQAEEHVDHSVITGVEDIHLLEKSIGNLILLVQMEK